MRLPLSLLVLSCGCCVLTGACGGNPHAGFGLADGSDSGSSGIDSGGGPPGGSVGSSSGSSGGSSSGGASSGSLLGDAGAGEAGPRPSSGDPTTCAEAAQSHSYVGCDYWPTVTANIAWSNFDFAAVVANAGTAPANIKVTGPGNTEQTAVVPPGQLASLYLPWVSELKGPDGDNCGATTPMRRSVLSRGGAYHLTSSVPVTVYQFSALEYAGHGGPPGKDWSSCPGNTLCMDPRLPAPTAIGCYSFSNDASLLLPSTAMTGNYWVTGHQGETFMPSFVAVTATADNTTVKVKVSSTGTIMASASAGVAATHAGGTLSLAMNAGDVAELMGDLGSMSDLSGSRIQATQPIQVITGSACMNIPDAAQACDHIEESNFPAETLGQDYFVAQPVGPNGDVVGHQVRIYGNFDGTHLTYSPSAPPNCPATIDAGQVVECGMPVSTCHDDSNRPIASCGAGNVVTGDFEVKGDHAFAVGTFSQGAELVDPSTLPPKQQGDPDQSLATAVKQYRTKYVFLAPTDYEDNYAVVIAPAGTTVSIDGTQVTAKPTPIGSTGFGVLRVSLGAGNAGAHVLTASNPVGLQVMGYGAYTSYTYPGGLNLDLIAPPPPPIN
jgi:hypothetical protein